ncbi:NYN domain-containing protein [Clostridium tepidum]|jgi:predicted RNA-binding protein with PIN domain|uniref:RNA-binding protein n=1 Tax=Clostridium tepidum TaxID=1962263 RepID=A0A1S9I1U1_9CLOT|nr:NYN domain-containing protein [Clostridium tepidum]MCR1935665.1 NYN domain-containing protein [Clostridium tepidum]MDU6879091.1 NYN domain-containing protein [Clostridium botulinum]OOO61312.1 RNA-binding protein [Clostridium tepidum]OOO64122.1 RNA-binding protein [Clostridium tepidum]
MKYIFVDAYNVINSWKELKKIKDYNLEMSREQLLDILNNYASYNQYRIYVVFDAHQTDGAENIEKINNNLIVVFTREGETADSFIERYINDLGRKIDVSVVTSDSLEQQLIFQRGATRISSLEFYSQVKETENNIKNKIKKEFSKRGNRLEEVLQEDLLEKLEKIRRST